MTPITRYRKYFKDEAEYKCQLAKVFARTRRRFPPTPQEDDPDYTTPPEPFVVVPIDWTNTIVHDIKALIVIAAICGWAFL